MKRQDSIEHYWMEQAPAFDEIDTRGIERFVNSIPEVGRLFEHSNDCRLCCIDERTPYGSFHMAGSGILRELEEAARRTEAVGVTMITSHAECGAARLAAALGDSRDLRFSQEQLSKELADCVSAYHNRVRIDGFTTPAFT